MNEGRSTFASVCNLALLAWLAVVAGLLGIHVGITKPFVGFRIFGFGLLASVPILVLSIIAMLRTRGAARREGRRSALQATLLSGALLVLFAVLAAPGAQVPAINDITTDRRSPAFVEALQAPENQNRDP
jgi:cytochrome bd-type quinol oxidase subunit 2